MLLLSAVVACGAASSGAPGAGEADTAQAQPQNIDHLEPPRDSVGPRPARFTWSAVKDAESYELHIWSEVDMKMFEQQGITATTVPWPDGLELPLGTYFWAVVAQRGGKPVAESGLSAFVITE
jgi:hypothetical protein